MANWNGEITPAEAAKIPIFDRGFLYGDSIYEVFRTYEGVPFYAKEHMDRLENSARLAKINISQERSLLESEIKRTVAAAAPQEDVFVRYTITRGSGKLNINPSSTTKTSYLILVTSLPQWNPRFSSEGVRMMIPQIRRLSPLTLDPNIKGGNYLNSVLAAAEAEAAGCDDALMLSIEGKITEATNSNVCFVINGEVVSPKHESGTNTGNLLGITKQIVSHLCEKIGVPYIERAIMLNDIKAATEALQCSATREIMPLLSLKISGTETLTFPSGGGPVIASLRNAYADYVKQYAAAHRGEAFF